MEELQLASTRTWRLGKKSNNNEPPSSTPPPQKPCTHTRAQREAQRWPYLLSINSVCCGAIAGGDSIFCDVYLLSKYTRPSGVQRRYRSSISPPPPG